MLKLLPKELLIKRSIDDDCVKFYYKPILGYFYYKRLYMIKKLLKNYKFNNLLEIGYGSGIFFPTLNEYTEKLYGIDIHNQDKEVLKKLQQVNLSPTLSVGSILDLPYENNFFDCVVCISVLEHIVELDKAVSEVKRVLKTDGIFIIGVPTKNFFMDFVFQKIFKFDSTKFHPSNHKNIIFTIKKYFEIQKIVNFPVILPIDVSFYVAIEGKKT